MFVDLDLNKLRPCGRTAWGTYQISLGILVGNNPDLVVLYCEGNGGKSVTNKMGKM